ncbi:MAG: exodeoxyribonuclease VII small subunit [Blastocatellia bacterium]|nr:exodeoxyribonuclease VII small subunit [Blastocatellia bacterium]
MAKISGENAGKKGFEESLSQLEMIVRQLESGELPLERALELFEEGVVLARQCQSQLEEAERKVELLLRERGEIKTIPFEPVNFEQPAENNPENNKDNTTDATGSTRRSIPENDEQEEKLNDAIPF